MAPVPRKKKGPDVGPPRVECKKPGTQRRAGGVYGAAALVAAISLGCGLYYMRTHSVVVRFRDANAEVPEAVDVNISLTEADFKRHLQTSSLYASHNGKRLRVWRDVLEANKGLGDNQLVLLQGPQQDVAQTRHFQWPGTEKGHRVVVADVPTYDAAAPTIELETLSINPGIFYVRNFMSSAEADALVSRATSSNNPYSIRPSTVGHQSWTQGSGASSTDNTRTSENGFDLDSPTARRLKDRAWKLLRLSGPYDETMVDGFQVLRYKQRQAYIAHMDSFAVGTSQDHNWDPSRGGTNRMATLLVYLSDVDAGGSTVFPHVDSETPSEIPKETEDLFEKGSWEMKLNQQCYTKLAVPPKKGNAILFYSQRGGKLNSLALHGGCPVLNGTKWAANLWFWNQCRFSQCYERHRKAGVKMDAKNFKQG